MTSANGISSLRTENSVFLSLESPIYLLCVIFSLLHFFGRRPKGGGGAWPKWPNGNTPVAIRLSSVFVHLPCRRVALQHRLKILVLIVLKRSISAYNRLYESVGSRDMFVCLVLPVK